jgi:hypothetical protein
VLLQTLLNPQFSGVIANPSQSTVFWCYCKTFSIHSFLVLLQTLLNPQFSGVIAKPSQSTVFWCYCKTFSIHSFLVLLQNLLNPQFSGVIVTTYSGPHSNFTIGRAGAEMK